MSNPRSSAHGRASRTSISTLPLLLIWTALASLASAQNYQFTGALQIVYGDGSTYTSTSGGGGGSGGSGSTAVQAQCPADHPVSCTNIQQPYYCCPSDNYCSWANSVVACCPNGKTCYGSAQATTTYWQPTTTYAQQPTTVVVAGGGGVVTSYANTPATTVGYEGAYCSTLVAIGPGLPTTEAGNCGTILIVEADAIRQAVLDSAKMMAFLVGLHLIGGLVFAMR